MSLIPTVVVGSSRQYNLENGSSYRHINDEQEEDIRYEEFFYFQQMHVSKLEFNLLMFIGTLIATKVFLGSCLGSS